jgi:LysM repeat protein
VKSGDTLWEVSKHYLKDPFLWPQIWEINSHVKNPHWIYPGDQILIKKMVVMNQEPAEGAPQPTKQPEAQALTRPAAPAVPAAVGATPPPASSPR